MPWPKTTLSPRTGARRKSKPLWAVLSVIPGVVLLGGHAIGALIKGELNVPFAGDVTEAQQPVLFYGVVIGLAALAILAFVAGYSLLAGMALREGKERPSGFGLKRAESDYPRTPIEFEGEGPVQRHVGGGGPAFFPGADRIGLEGIVSKRLDSARRRRKSSSVPVKRARSDDVRGPSDRWSAIQSSTTAEIVADTAST